MAHLPSRESLKGLDVRCACGWRGKSTEGTAQPGDVVRCPQCQQPVEMVATVADRYAGGTMRK